MTAPTPIERATANRRDWIAVFLVALGSIIATLGGIVASVLDAMQ